MTAATLALPLSEEIRARARAMDARLRESPFYGRMLRGELDAQEYAAWLVQQHKYVRLSSHVATGMANATIGREDELHASLYRYATWEYEEEKGHDDLLLQDLSALWDCSVAEVLGRVEMTLTAPAIDSYRAMFDRWMHRHPLGGLGAAMALETTASLQSDDIYENMRAHSGIPGIKRALRFFKAHRAEVEIGHSSAAAERIDRVVDPAVRNAIFFFANAALVMYEGIAHYLSEVYGEGQSV